MIVQGTRNLIFRVVLCAAVLLCAGFPTCARASCDSKSPTMYSDISDVLFERNGCGGLRAAPARTLNCSRYWLYVGHDEQQYSQFSLRDQIGNFSVGIHLADVQKLLEKHSFFELNAEPIMVTDVRESILTVKLCARVIRLMVYPDPKDYSIGGGQALDPDIISLFSEIDALVSRAHKEKLSDKPESFRLTGIFNAL